jgi:hypothetical protein
VTPLPPPPIHFSQGRLYIAREAYDRYLPGTSTVILLRNEDDLLVLPVSSAVAGGYIMKIRNAAGDRVVNGADFFRDQGIGDDQHWQGVSDWCQSYAGIRLYELFRM